MDGMLHALDMDTGAKQWEFDLENPIISTPVMVDGLLVVASDGGLVYVISPAASIQQPPFIDVKAKVRAPLEAKNGIVYIHALDRRVTALRVGRTIQDELWEYDTETGECNR
jgi:outer membrane protein assembly factor BamB